MSTTAGGPAIGPVAPPHNPLRDPSPHAALLAELTEKVRRQLERAAADDAAARERQGQTSQGARGEALDGAVEVRVDAKGLVAGVRFGPDIVGLSSADLREHTLQALEDAKSQLGLVDASAVQNDPRDREVAAAIMNLFGRDDRS